MKQEIDEKNLLEKWKGERTPDLSLAAQPKALFGCSVSGDFAIVSVSVFVRVRDFGFLFCDCLKGVWCIYGALAEERK